MSNITTEALRQFWPAGLYKVPQNPKNGMRDWLALKNYATFTPPISEDEFYLDLIKGERSNDIYNAFAYDSNRFSTSAIESTYGLEIIMHQSMSSAIAWPAIKAYYASFYAAHAILRFFGKSCTLIEGNDMSPVNSIFSIYHANIPKLVTGYYIINILEKENRVHFQKAKKRPHEQLWQEFIIFLDDIINTLKLGSTQYQVVMMQIESLRSNLQFNNLKAGIWLSNIRDDINYKDKHGAWYPYAGIKKLQIDKIRRLLTNPLKQSIDIELSGPFSNELERFFVTALYLVSLCCEILESLDQESGGKGFPNQRPLKLLKLLKS